jgi:amidase
MKARGERTRHVRDWMLFLERYPLVVGPVSTEPPFEVGFDTTTVAVPVGHAAGIPLGGQVIGSRYREDLCLDAAEVIEARHGLPTPIDPVP